MCRELLDAVERANNDPAVGAMILTGAGRAFCAGRDISEWKDDRSPERHESAPDPQANPMLGWPRQIQHSKPIICAINGIAVGGGVTLTLPCDVRIASESASLAMPFVRLGLVPELASTRLLAAIVGLTNALELLLSGRSITARAAASIGLVNAVVPDDELQERASVVAHEIAANPVESLRATKRLVWRNLGLDVDAVIEREMAEFLAAQGRPEFGEAVRALAEKRPPRFNS